MTAAELGILLLCTELSDGMRPLSTARLRQLRACVHSAARPAGEDRAVTREDLTAIGCRGDAAEEILALLSREEALKGYLSQAAERGIVPLALTSRGYPNGLRQKLGDTAPPVLFARGELSLLGRPAVSLVGSRELSRDGLRFARRVGELAAKEGFVLISGNARGADQAAQAACLSAGGSVISVLADELFAHDPAGARLLFLSERGWHLPFSAARARSRNRLIHALGEKVLVAQTGLRGGTYSGTEENLKKQYTPVFVHDDGSPGARRLAQLGASEVPISELTSLRMLEDPRVSFLPR